MKDNLTQLVPIAKQAHQWRVKVGYSCYEILQGANPDHFIQQEEQLKELQQIINELLKLKSTFNSITNSRYYLKKVITFFRNGGHLAGCQAKRKFVHVSQDGYLKPCANQPSYMHYSEYKPSRKLSEPVSCDQCWEACRGEMEASLTFERAWELIAHFPYA
jgi:MoaA/NifB/PqqE/SkfB family radical SAM enzyme